MSLPATEPFTGTTALSGSWTTPTMAAGYTCSCSSDQAKPDHQGVGPNFFSCFAFWNADSFNADQYSQIQVITVSSGLSEYVEVVVRAAGTSAATWNGYTLLTDGASGSGNTEIRKWINGVETSLQSIATTVSSGDKIKLQVSGSTLKAFQDTGGGFSQVGSDQATGGELTSGAAGFGMFEGQASLATRADNWEGGNVASAVVASMVVMPMVAPNPNVGPMALRQLAPVPIFVDTTQAPVTDTNFEFPNYPSNRFVGPTVLRNMVRRQDFFWSTDVAPVTDTNFIMPIYPATARSGVGPAVTRQQRVHYLPAPDLAPVTDQNFVFPVFPPSVGTGPQTLRSIPVQLPMFALSGAQSYFVSVAGTVTPAGALAFLAGKALAGGESPAGAIANAASKLLTGTETPTGALIKQAQKALAGGESPSGTVVKLIGKGLTGVLAPVGAVAKLISKLLSGNVTPTGALALVRAVLIALAGAITPSGALGKQPSKGLGGAVVPGGLLAKFIAKAYAGAVTPTGSLRRLISKAFIGVIIPIGNLARRGTSFVVSGLRTARINSENRNTMAGKNPRITIVPEEDRNND